MINIPMKSAAPLNKNTLGQESRLKIQGPHSVHSISSINRGSSSKASPSAQSPAAAHTSSHAAAHTSSHAAAHTSSHAAAPVPAPGIPLASRPLPQLLHPVQKGQKIPLCPSGQISKISARLGWHTADPGCDVDVSAFLLDSRGKVIGDTWFVFYGQTESPDGSTTFSVTSGEDLEVISIDFTRLNPAVRKIVFVMTINEALEKNLNFSMLSDAYIRIFDSLSNVQLVSFRMNEYYDNVTSMMIGEVYLHNDAWKFNAIGNGVARDLAGLCSLYGVQVE